VKSELLFLWRQERDFKPFLPSWEQIEDDLFNPDYVEVDRIMDFARSTDDRGEVTEIICVTLGGSHVLTEGTKSRSEPGQSLHYQASSLCLTETLNTEILLPSRRIPTDSEHPKCFPFSLPDSYSPL
jgi:hypothetical protein